jgi:hypothetical protein
VNKVIWMSTSFTAIIYISFGIMAAMSFDDVGTNILVILASKEVNLFTRVCAALFGVSIIGCSVPIYCIIIKNTLYAGGVLNAPMSFVCGVLLPYILSWTLYQGEALMNMLNWTGLVVNGLVAFVLPLLLASFTLKRRDRYYSELQQLSSLSYDGREAISIGLLDYSTDKKTDSVSAASSSFLVSSPTAGSPKSMEDKDGGGFELVSLDHHHSGHSNGSSPSSSSSSLTSTNKHRHHHHHHHHHHQQQQQTSRSLLGSWMHHHHHPALNYGSDSSNEGTDDEEEAGPELEPCARRDSFSPESSPSRRAGGAIARKLVSPSSSASSTPRLEDDDDEVYEERIRRQHRPQEEAAAAAKLALDSDTGEDERMPLILDAEDRSQQQQHPKELKRLKRLQTLERRLRSVVAPLPACLHPYLAAITYSLTMLFSIAITATILVDLILGLQPD